ncbi:MAG: hypothetical protein HQ481_14400 [Alphaproteobacteria bacterium]|nr:hypothetical protein [Alphaproteobacteria bacterium]
MDKNTERYGWSVNDWSAAAGISRSSTYELITSGDLETAKFGNRRIISTHPREWIESLKGAA